MQNMAHHNIENNQGAVAQDIDGHEDYIVLAEQGVLTQTIRYRLISAVPVDVERRRKVWLMPTIAIILIVIFGIAVHKNNCPQVKAINDAKLRGEIDGVGDVDFDCLPESFGRFSMQFDSITDLGIDKTTAKDMGGYYEEDVPNKPWMLFTSLWLHIDLVHLIANIAALLVVGTLLERKFGWVLIGIIYIVSGLGGSMFVHFASNWELVLCSSAPVMGLVGAMLSELFTNWSLHKNKTARFILVSSITIVFIIIVGNSTLVGGGLVGFLLGLILLPLPRPRNTETSAANPTSGRERYHCCQVVSGILALVVLILMFIIMLIFLIKYIHFMRSMDLRNTRNKTMV